MIFLSYILRVDLNFEILYHSEPEKGTRNEQGCQKIFGILFVFLIILIENIKNTIKNTFRAIDETVIPDARVHEIGALSASVFSYRKGGI